MIRVNLLYSTHERPGSTFSASAESKPGVKFDKLTLTAVGVSAMLVLAIGFEIFSSQSAVSSAQEKLVEQQKVEMELAAVLKEQKDLEQKIQSVEARIEAIKKLRSSQSGPSSVLDAVRERIANSPGIFLESITQKGGELEIKGSSPDEAAVTQFGRSLEFSSGLFSNLSIETQRREIQPAQTSTSTPASPDAPKPEVVGFTIKCAYTPGKGAQGQTVATTTPQAPANASTGARPVPPPPQIAQRQ